MCKYGAKWYHNKKTQMIDLGQDHIFWTIRNFVQPATFFSLNQ